MNSNWAISQEAGQVNSSQAISQEAGQVNGIRAISHYIKQEYLEKAKNNQRYLPIPLAVQMIKFAREVGDQAILDYFSQDYTKAVLKSKEYLTIELAIEIIKLARETGNQETLSQLIKICIDFGKIGLTHRRYRIGGVNYMQSVPLTIELLKAACEIDNKQVPQPLVSYVSSVVAEKSKYLSTDLATTILKFAHKINEQGIMDTFSKNYLSTMLQAQEQVPVELAVELIKLAQEQKTYHQANIESYYHKNITVERCHLGSLPLDTIIDIRRLAQVFGDDKLAQLINVRLEL